jgi:hypothetical protein
MQQPEERLSGKSAINTLTSYWLERRRKVERACSADVAKRRLQNAVILSRELSALHARPENNRIFECEIYRRTS